MKLKNFTAVLLGVFLWAVHIFVPLAMLFLVLVWPQKKSFEIDFLDVGQGDGIYLCTGNGVAMFVDGGSTDIKNVGQYRILPFLKAKGVRKISCWFVSHTDADHISGLEEVLASGYPVERLLFAEAVKNKEKTKSLAKLAEKAGTVVQYMEAEETLSCYRLGRPHLGFPAHLIVNPTDIVFPVLSTTVTE